MPDYLVITGDEANRMANAEERDQLITTYCATFKDIADSIAQRCEILLADGNNLFNDEQKTDLRHIQNAVQKFLSRVDTASQVTKTHGYASMESMEFVQFMANWINDIRNPLNLMIAYAQFFLEGGMGSLNNKQHETIEDVYKLTQSLVPTINELLISSRQA